MSNPTPEVPANTQPSTPAPVKRGKGRPKGSKNKPKVPAPAVTTEAAKVTSTPAPITTVIAAPFVVDEEVTETPVE